MFESCGLVLSVFLFLTTASRPRLEGNVRHASFLNASSSLNASESPVHGKVFLPIGEGAPAKTADEKDGFKRIKLGNCLGRWGFKTKDGDIIVWKKPQKPDPATFCKAAKDCKFKSIMEQGFKAEVDAQGKKKFKKEPDMNKAECKENWKFFPLPNPEAWKPSGKPDKICENIEHHLQLTQYFSDDANTVLIPTEGKIKEKVEIIVPEFMRDQEDKKGKFECYGEKHCTLSDKIILIKGPAAKDYAPEDVTLFKEKYVDCAGERKAELEKLIFGRWHSKGIGIKVGLITWLVGTMSLGFI